MGKIAFVFSGQGVQHAGMGMDIYESDASVHSLFDKAEEVRNGTLEQMASGSPETLRETENTQPCLYLADLAPAMALYSAGIRPSGVAGFSLGELPALAFAGAFDYMTGFKLTIERGKLMGAATREHDASMAAVVKLENSVVESACAQFSQIYPVNYNCPGQLVVAGDAEQMKEFSQHIRALGGIAMPLKVSGGFHSPFMNGAAAKFAALLEELQKTEFKAPDIPVYANRTSEPYEHPICGVLSEQMNHPVLWEKTIRRMAADGFDTFIETGVGNVLAKLISKILPDSRVFAAETVQNCAKIVETLTNEQ